MRQCKALTCSYSSVGSDGRTAWPASGAAAKLAGPDGPGVPATTISIASSRRPVSLPRHPASSMKRTQKSGPGSSLRSSERDTWTPRIRARWSARSRWRPSSVRDVAARLSIGGLEVVVVGHHPRIAAASALRAVDHQRAGLEGNARQSAGRDVDVRTGEHERAEVLVAAAEPTTVQDRLHGKRHHRLADEAARVGQDAVPKLLSLLLRGSRAD